MNEIIEKPVIFKNEKSKVKLWGVLSLPKTKEKVPAVIIAHGFCATKSRRRFVDLGRKFAERGIAVLRFDFSGCGDSESELKNLSVRQEVKDLESAFNFLIRQPEIDKKRVGFLGESLGGLIVCLYQASNPVAKVLVLVAPALDQKSLMEIWQTPEQIKEWRSRGYLDTPKGRIGIQYLNEAEDYTQIASKIDSPILIIHGDKDDDVPLEFSRRLLRVFAGEKKLEIVEGADHKFDSYQSSTELINLSLKWLKKYL